MSSPQDPHDRSSSGGGDGRGNRGRPRRDRESEPRRGGGDRSPDAKRIQAPGGAREPIGRDRAATRSGAPPRRPRPAAAPARPPLPDDEEPVLPRGVRREIDRALGPGRRARDVALALSIGAEAIEEERPDVALEVLAWAKHEAPRVSAVREAYGVALYLAERFDDALSELQAYRRLTGSVDQNHLIADCLRALGRDVDRIAEAAEALLETDDAPADRRGEAAIVWAAALADGGDVGAGRSVLRRFLDGTSGADGEERLRAVWFAAELARRADDRADAERHLRNVVEIDPDYLDATAVLQELIAGR